MRTLQEKYNGVLEGNYSKAQFKRDAAIEMPQFVSNVNSFDDAVAILKNKGAITEAKTQAPKYSTAKPADHIAPDVLDTAIKFELDKKYGTLDVTPEQFEKCKEMAIKNLSKDVTYYVKQDSIQLDTPGEKMEKAKVVKEEISKEEAWKEYQEKRHVTDKTIAAAEKDFNKGWEEGKFRDGNYAANEAIQNIENDEQTKRRIANLTNQLLQDADPRDETVKAYAISVKNDLESGDASRMSQYKNILSLDDLKDDMEHYLTHDVDQLEEKDGPVYPEDKHTMTPDELGHDTDEGYNAGENPKKFKESDKFEPGKFYIRDLKSGRILNAISTQGSNLVFHYDTEADAQAQADWITRWEGDPGRFEVLSGDEAEELVNKQIGAGLDEQAESLQAVTQKVEQKLQALGLQTKVFEGEFEVPKNARDMIEKNPKLGALSYSRDKSIIAGQPESERLEVVVHKDHLEDLKKIANEFKMPSGSVQAFAGTDFVRLRHNADVVAEGTYSKETLKEMFKKIIAKVITE